MASPGVSWSPAFRQSRSVFAWDVFEGLRKAQKTLPCQYLYDALGSALFDAITLLPEYGLTRADERILARCAPRLAQRLPQVGTIVELGSGSGVKTRAVLETFAPRQQRLRYVPIDGSKAALDRCRAELADIPGVAIEGIVSLYLDGLGRALEGRGNEPALVLFLGGSIGNFEPEDAVRFLSEVRALLQEGDALLIGADLEKSPSVLLKAYDDPLGVTAAFNLNILARINRELDANFDLTRFRHEARWAEAEKRVEMHLVSRARQRVRIGALQSTFAFEADESIWTESSHRFTLRLLKDVARRSGFQVAERWVDDEWVFAESLWVATPT
jgi:dimethylhistidine N-methyltransferase